MKLFESIDKTNSTLHDAIQNMVNTMFHEELDEPQLDEIVDRLSLSDILALNDAYTAGDRAEVSAILGPLPQLEYSMGNSSPRKPTSAAATRPAPNKTKKAPARDQSSQSKTAQSSNYSGGVQNGVSTQNVDSEDDPDAVMQDDQPVEESDGMEGPYWEGHRAYTGNGFDDLNPYPEGTEEHEEWNDGYAHAQSEIDSYDDVYDDEADAANAKLMYKDESIAEINRIAELAGYPLKEGPLDYSMHKKKKPYQVFKQAMEKAGWGPLFDNWKNTEYGFSYVYDGFMTSAVVFVYDRIVDLWDVDLNDVESVLAEADRALRQNKDNVYRTMDELIKTTIDIAKEHGMDPVHEAKKGSFDHNDDVIVTSGEWEGETGIVMSARPNSVTVRLYNHDFAMDFEPHELDLNDYADSDEEENDLRRHYGDDEYDHLHDDLGYKDESINEGSGEQWNSKEVIRALLQIADDEHLASLERLANRIRQSYPDSVDMSDIEDILREPDMRATNREDVDYALGAAGFKDMYEEKLDKSGAESIIRDMADRYQAAMAGMSHEDEWEILSQAKELAKEYGVDLDMYFEHRYENPEQKVIQMQEWLKRRAGIA